MPAAAPEIGLNRPFPGQRRISGSAVNPARRVSVRARCAAARHGRHPPRRPRREMAHESMGLRFAAGNSVANRASDLPIDQGVRKEGSPMAHAVTPTHLWSGVGRFFEHVAAVVIGFVLMVLGLALGVTMIMLPVGVVIGLIGVALFVGGIFARIDER